MDKPNMARDIGSLAWDYLVFILFLVISSVVPLWGQLFGKKKERSKADYVFAAGKITIFAMMMSIARGTLGVRSFLGYPSELFYRGTTMWETIYGMMNAYPIVLYIFIPVYFSLGITSVYQYLDLRFNSRLVRCLASATFILRQILTLGVTVYTPSVALNTVIGIPYWVSICGLTAISIFFTILGGLKAAITADVIQGVTMILVSIVIFIQGVVETGGLDKVYEINRDNDRFKFFTATGDLSTRVDTVSAWLGQLFMSLSLMGCQQNFVQRYVSMKNFAEVKKTMLTNIPVIFVLFSLSWLVGMSIFSTYFNCDPLQAGYIKKMDEILPFFVEDKFLYLPGFLGLFMATIFNGALSLNVSNVNSLATVTWEDFLARLPNFKGYTDKQQLNVIKMVGVAYSVLIMGVAFSVGLLPGVIESAMLMTSVTSGPLLGAFLLAMLIPIANWKGASAGMICSHVIVIWLTFGSFTVEKPNSILSTSVDGCTNDTFSQGITKPQTSWLLQNTPLEVNWDHNDFHLTSTMTPMSEKTGLQQWYSISYMYWSIIGTFITLFVGTLVSYFTSSADDTYEAKLLHPLIVKCLNFMPGAPRQFKQPLPESNNTSQTTVNQDAITVDVIMTAHDNFAFEKELTKGESKNAEQQQQQQRITNMTLANANSVDEIETDKMESKPQKDNLTEKRRESVKFDDSFYTPQTTGVYKKFEADC